MPVKYCKSSEKVCPAGLPGNPGTRGEKGSRGRRGPRVQEGELELKVSWDLPVNTGKLETPE